MKAHKAKRVEFVVVVPAESDTDPIKVLDKRDGRHYWLVPDPNGRDGYFQQPIH